MQQEWDVHMCIYTYIHIQTGPLHADVQIDPVKGGTISATRMGRTYELTIPANAADRALLVILYIYVCVYTYTYTYIHIYIYIYIYIHTDIYIYIYIYIYVHMSPPYLQMLQTVLSW